MIYIVLLLLVYIMMCHIEKKRNKRKGILFHAPLTMEEKEELMWMESTKKKYLDKY